MNLDEILANGTIAELLGELQRRHHTKEELVTALITAVRLNSLEKTEVLLNSGADPNVRLEDNWMALHCAVEHQNECMIRLLLRKGADVNMRDQSGSTPLHVAVDIEGDGAWQRGAEAESSISKLLLGLGADPTIRNDSGKLPLDIAIDYDHQAAIRLLGVQPKS